MPVQNKINKRNIARIKRVFLFYIILVFIPLYLYAEEQAFHTIQTGSYVDIKSAQKQFDSIVKRLNEQELSFLRIEKVGEFYSPRLGKFKDYATANKFLQANKPQLQGAIIIKANIVEGRVIQRYTKDSVNKEITPSGKPLPGITPDELRDVQLLQQPLPVIESKASEPAKDSVSEEVADNELRDVRSSQKPLPADNSGIFSNVKGRFYISDYYSNDTDDFEFHILTSRLNLYKHKDKESRYYYALDARVRKKIFSGEIQENVPEWRVEEAFLGLKFLKQKLDVIGGRQNIYELYNTTIDGLNIMYSFDNDVGLGIFGGLAPDKEDESLNTDFKSIGGYVFLNKEKHKMQFGYENLTYKGKIDREYFSLRIYSKFHEKLRLNASSSASINQLTENFEVENANINLLYTHSKKLRFNIFYNYFRTIKYYASTREFLVLPELSESFFLDDNSRTRAGIRADYKLMKGFKVYTSAAYERRKEDGEDKLRLTGGLRKYDLYGFDISGRYTYIDDFSAKNDEFNAEITRNFFNKVDVSIYASREEKKLDVQNAYTIRALTYGSSIYWMISRSYFMSSFIESYEKDNEQDEEDDKHETTSVFTQLGYKF